MKTLTKILLIVLAILVAGCSGGIRAPQKDNVEVTGSGNLVSREVALSGFDRVEAGLNFDLTIRPGEDFSVVIYSDDNFIDYIQVGVQGKTLSFDFIPGYAYDLNGVTLRADVTIPDLAGLELYGSSHANLAGFRSSGNLEVELSGSSFLDGSLEAEKSSFALYGSTYLKLSGTAQDMLMDACGSNLVDLSDYRVGAATVLASCNSRVVVNVVNVLAGEASQNSQVYYVSPPASSTITSHEHAFVGQK